MRFLDLDLDFFLNENTYGNTDYNERQGSEYKPWSVFRVRHFLEDRCGLSRTARIHGRIVKSHDGILDFWQMLIQSHSLTTPFEVIHIDAHPDLCIGEGLHLTAGFLHFDQEHKNLSLIRETVHQGNYLTFAIVCGWISSITWIPLVKHLKRVPQWNGDSRSLSRQINNRDAGNVHIHELPEADRESYIPFRMLPWHDFIAVEPFDYMALSKSPDFTPPESDTLIGIIQEYINQI